jgi:hypothetical protein
VKMVVLTKCERHGGRCFGGGDGVVVVNMILVKSYNIWGKGDGTR